MKRPIIITISLLIISSVFYGLYIYFQPAENASKRNADISVSADSMLYYFESNTNYADSLFKNKVVEITGLINKTDTGGGTTKVLFDKKGDFIIVASLEKNMKNDLNKISTDKDISIRGFYTGYTIIDDMFMIPAEIKIDQCIVMNEK